MIDRLTYPDLVSFYKVTTTGYRGSKVILAEAGVNCFFLQNTGFSEGNFQEQTDSDAVCYPDPENSFIKEYKNRLEGMYIVTNITDEDQSQNWYKIISVSVNRDHLLENEIDNIECTLKKVSEIEIGGES
jgi:hypothetical protein